MTDGEELFSFATGVLKYAPDVALGASIVHLIMARDGAIKWHNATHGGEKKAPSLKTPEGQKAAAANFRAFAAEHNKKRAAKTAR